VYTPPDAGSPPPAPPPPSAPSPADVGEIPQAPRYQYLVGRLRNRQITMEEATELFAIQRQQVALLLARTNALAAAAAAPSQGPRAPRPIARPATPGAPAVPFPVEGMDFWGEGLLFLALGAGLLAALAKRAQGPPPKDSSRPPAPASKSRQS
jgi:hypothetical protein